MGVQFGDERLSLDSRVNPLGAVGQVNVSLPGALRAASSAGGVSESRKNLAGPRRSV